MSEAAKRRHSFTLGYLTALCGPVIAMPEREPVAYLYNGVRLPGLPEWDKTVYPYAAITCDDSTSLTQVYLRAFSEPITQVDSDKKGYFNSGSASQTNFQFLYGTEDGWRGPNYGTGTAFNCAHVVWSNFDILNSDGTVYLAASEPVPVYE